MAELPSLYVHLIPSMIPPGSLRGGVAVVIDVLRATTTIVHALDAGAESIAPCLEIAEARSLAASLPPGRSLLTGERQGLAIERFDLANSPGSFTPANTSGKTVVMTTTNGTRAIHAALDADRVLIAAFVNLSATLNALRVEKRTIYIIPSGTNGQVSLEDSLLAGALGDGLSSTHRASGNDEAILAVEAWRGVRGRPLAETIARGAAGHRVEGLGLHADLIAAADVDRYDLVAEVSRDPLRIVRT